MSMCSKDNLNQTIFAAVFALLLILNILTTSCLAAPSNGRTKTTKNEQKLLQLHNYCGASRGKSGNQARHSKAKAIKVLRTQFRVTYNHFQNSEEKIDKLYSEVKNNFNDQYDLQWLPNEYDLNWYFDEIRDLDKEEKNKELLTALHTALQKYYVTFFNLKESQLIGDDPQKLFKQRTKVLGDMFNRIKALLCEAETALINKRFTIPERISHTLPELNPNPDHTGTLIQDWGVFLHYRKFLQNWNCILIDAMAKKKKPMAKLLKACKMNSKKRS